MSFLDPPGHSVHLICGPEESLVLIFLLVCRPVLHHLLIKHFGYHQIHCLKMAEEKGTLVKEEHSAN